MSKSLLETIINDKIINSKNKIKQRCDYTVLIEQCRDEIWEAFLNGCTVSDIYNALIKQKKFFGTEPTFRRLFKKTFPNANKIRSEYINTKIAKATTF